MPPVLLFEPCLSGTSGVAYVVISTSLHPIFNSTHSSWVSILAHFTNMAPVKVTNYLHVAKPCGHFSVLTLFDL